MQKVHEFFAQMGFILIAAAAVLWLQLEDIQYFFKNVKNLFRKKQDK